MAARPASIGAQCVEIAPLRGRALRCSDSASCRRQLWGRPKARESQLRDEGAANLPVKAERINQTSQSPAVRIAYREHL